MQWIWWLWQQRKSTTQQALEALLQSRGRRSLRAMVDIKSMDLHIGRCIEQVEIDRAQGSCVQQNRGH